MPAKKYTQEHLDFVKKNAEGVYSKDLAEMFNEHFGVNDMTEKKIQSFKKNHKIKSNVKRKRRTQNEKLLNDEQEEFVKNNYVGRTINELTQLINEHFGTSFNEQQIRSYKKRKKYKSGVDKKFKKGHIPVSKGKKGMFNVGGNKTSFKKGCKPHNYQPIGTERINGDGYIDVKISDEGPLHLRWKAKHRIVWERENGPIPKGHAVIMLDNDKQNVSPGNLKLVTNKELLELNRRKLRFDNKEMTETGYLLAKLNVEVREKKKSN